MKYEFDAAIALRESRKRNGPLEPVIDDSAITNLELISALQQMLCLVSCEIQPLTDN